MKLSIQSQIWFHLSFRFLVTTVVLKALPVFPLSKTYPLLLLVLSFQVPFFIMNCPAELTLRSDFWGTEPPF